MLSMELTSHPSRGVEDTTGESYVGYRGPSQVVSHGNNISNWLENIFYACV